MLKMARYFYHHTGGGILIEFALILPVFILFLLGTVDLGMLFWQRASMSYALSETSRYIYVNPTATQSEIETYYRSRIIILGNSIQFSASINPSVSATLNASLNYSFFSAILPRLNSSKTMTISLQ